MDRRRAAGLLAHELMDGRREISGPGLSPGEKLDLLDPTVLVLVGSYIVVIILPIFHMYHVRA